MKKSLKGPVLIFLIAFAVIASVVPLICFAALNWWPIEPLVLGIIYWVGVGVSLACAIVWALLQFKGGKETSILYLQLILVGGIQLLPPVTLLFFLAPLEWIFIVPLILDILAYLAFALVVVLTSRLANKAVETLEKVKSEEAPIVDAEKTFNNEDGTFKGSRVKVNTPKKED